MIFELCTDSYHGALIASKYHFKRIELCSSLDLSGLTPNYGLIKQCVGVKSIEAHVMIRPKSGNFEYDKFEIEQMISDIKISKTLGVRGVVFGILDNNNQVSPINKNLNDLAISLGLETTFHRAFDVISDYHKAIQQLIAYGFKRVLTSGQQATAEQGLELITELQMCYGDKIQIMAGSGISEKNVLEFVKAGIQQIHFTARKPIATSTKYKMGSDYEVDVTKIKSIMNLFS